MHSRLHSPPLRRPLAAWLVCAMLLAQMLGLTHRIAHADGPHERTLSGPEAHASLFDAHDDPADCRLFDQSAHADAIGIDPATTPSSAQPQAPLPRPPQLVAMGAQRAYLARGPPARA